MKVLIRNVLSIGLILSIEIYTPVTDDNLVTGDDEFVNVTMDEMPFGW